MNYIDAFRLAIDTEMGLQPDLNIFGQGVWHPLYTGHALDGLVDKYTKDRIRDCPISENAVTGMACGYALSGGRSLVMHPRIDFAIYAMDALVNTIPKWRYFLAQDIALPITICFFINRGKGLGPQHSQSLQSWLAHVPGLKIYYPSQVASIYHTLRWSLNAQDPVILFCDMALFDQVDEQVNQANLLETTTQQPQFTQVGQGGKLTIVSYGIMYARTKAILHNQGLLDKVDLIDLTILNHADHALIINSVKTTKHLLVIEDTWSFCSIGDSVIASVIKALPNTSITIEDLHLAPTFAPTAKPLEDDFYISDAAIIAKIESLIKSSK